jgi:hypothetical protein
MGVKLVGQMNGLAVACTGRKRAQIFEALFYLVAWSMENS